MKKIILLFLLSVVTMFHNSITKSNSENITHLDSVIYLKEIVAYPKKIKYITSKTTNEKIFISNKVYVTYVSRVPLNDKKTYRITGVQFYFKVEGKYSGFFVRPLVYSSKNNKPNQNLLNDNPICFVDKKLKNTFHFDLTGYDLVFNNSTGFFIGMSFPKREEDVNMSNFLIKAGSSSEKGVVSYVKGDCNNCPFIHFQTPDQKREKTLKYKLYYTEIQEED